MENIKLRFWCKKTERFVRLPRVWVNDSGELMWDYDGAELIAQMATGFKSIDGRDIYEGDKIYRLGVVKYRSGKFGFGGGEDRWFDLSDIDWRNLIIADD